MLAAALGLVLALLGLASSAGPAAGPPRVGAHQQNSALSVRIAGPAAVTGGGVGGCPLRRAGSDAGVAAATAGGLKIPGSKAGTTRFEPIPLRTAHRYEYPRGTWAVNFIEHANRWLAVKRGGQEQTSALKISASGDTRPKRTQTSGAAFGNGSAATSSRTITFLLTNAQGTAATAVDAGTGVVANRFYLPLGGARTGQAQASGWPDIGHGFLNAPTDAGSGLTHLGARDYDAALGRFSSVDPVC